MSLTQEYVKSILTYDPETGVFTRKVARRGCRAGEVVGWLSERNYVYIRIDGRNYRAHRLAWLYVYGVWPTKQIDHRDLDGSNNRIANLREADNRLNCANRRPYGESGVKGVRITRQGRWQATIKFDGNRRCLGTFDTKEEAGAAYMEAAREHYGDYARVT